jgi:hypothetical protein
MARAGKCPERERRTKRPLKAVTTTRETICGANNDCSGLTNWVTSLRRLPTRLSAQATALSRYQLNSRTEAERVPALAGSRRSSAAAKSHGVLWKCAWEVCLSRKEPIWQALVADAVFSQAPPGSVPVRPRIGGEWARSAQPANRNRNQSRARSHCAIAGTEAAKRCDTGLTVPCLGPTPRRPAPIAHVAMRTRPPIAHRNGQPRHGSSGISRSVEPGIRCCRPYSNTPGPAARRGPVPA